MTRNRRCGKIAIIICWHHILFIFKHFKNMFIDFFLSPSEGFIKSNLAMKIHICKLFSYPLTKKEKQKNYTIFVSIYRNSLLWKISIFLLFLVWKYVLPLLFCFVYISSESTLLHGNSVSRYWRQDAFRYEFPFPEKVALHLEVSPITGFMVSKAPPQACHTSSFCVFLKNTKQGCEQGCVCVCKKVH